MSGFVGPNNCTICIACFNNCSACPKHACQKRTMYLNNLDRVNKQVRMSSSLSLLKRRTLNVSKQVGQSANPRYLSRAGGPGDLISSVQRTNKCSEKMCAETTYRVPIAKRRTAYRGKVGVDKKHGSYARYLSRRVGGELRKEKMPVIRNKTAFIHQPRNRTGTAAGCTNAKGCRLLGGGTPSKFLAGTRTAFKCNDAASQRIANNTDLPNNVLYPKWSTPYNALYPPNKGDGILPLFGPAEAVDPEGNCCSTTCCENRIPNNCDDCSKLTGLLGNNTQCVPSGSCSCCPPIKRR